MSPILDIARALGDEGRLRIVGALRRGELCVCQIVELLELAPSTTSRHLSQLRSAGLIRSRKRGRWIHYRLATDDDREPSPGNGLVPAALQWVLPAMETDPRFERDQAALDGILATPPAVIAARQRDACCRSEVDSPGSRGSQSESKEM